MYMRQRTVGRMGRAAEPAAISTTIPASVGGINGLDSLMAMPPEDCIYTFNLMPVEYGQRLRKGYREWATGCVENPPRATGEVRTIVPFEASTQDPARDRLFAVTDEGIWDVTLFNTTEPEQVAVFTVPGAQAGRGVYCEFTGDAADAPGIRGHYLFYADGLNGLWQYDQATGNWEQPPSGIDPTDWYYLDPTDGTTPIPFPVENIAFITVHKQRIWVVLEDDDDAWYLPVGAISGELKRFYYGSKMANGGYLLGLWDWTIDGGDGVDDYLIAVSRGGDVIVYRGEDPEITPDGSSVGPWSLVGAWYIGEVPFSRRIVQAFGPNMFILSVYGLVSLRDLLQGSPVTVAGTGSPSRKINRFLRADVESGRDLAQWQIVSNPGDGFLQIITPSPSATPFLAYAMNFNTGAWGNWEGVPITCAADWSGEFYMGAAQSHAPGVVFIYDGALDGTTIHGVELFDPAEPLTGDPEWTQPSPPANEYACNTGGTSAVATIPVAEAPVVGTTYLIEYTVGTATPEVDHSVVFGLAAPEANAQYRQGSGNFALLYTANAGAAPEVTLIAGPDFDGEIANVSVRVAPRLGVPIQFRSLTSFQGLQERARNKRVGIARTIGIVAGVSAFNVEAVYDYQIEDEQMPPNQVSEQSVTLWDSALWDRVTWDFATAAKEFPVGVFGIGRAVAIAIRGNANTRINIVGWDLILTTGGYM